jgi:hypothetical protein
MREFGTVPVVRIMWGVVKKRGGDKERGRSR